MNRLSHPAAVLSHRLAAVALALAASGALVACGGGGSDGATTTAATPPGSTAAQAQLSGTAATGAAIANSTVTATNAKGVQATASTNASGGFSLRIDEGAPYVLSITDAAGKPWYSYAAAAGTANITPLTTLALLDANGRKPLADLAKSWATAALAADKVLASAAKVNAHLKTVMSANGVDANNYNIFATPFSADRTGYDAVLDALRLTLDCTATSCTETIRNPAGSVLVSWNGNIATTGITLSWSGTSASGSTTAGTVTAGLGSCKAPKPGTYSLVIKTSVAGLGAVPLPEVCIDGLSGKPSSQTEFCNASDVNAQLPAGVTIKSCSFSGNTGTITAQITTPITLDYSVTYTYVLN